MRGVPMSELARIRGLEIRYGERTALQGVDLAVESGTTVAVIGPNGAGKSTLLSALAGLVSPTSGTVTIHGARTALVLQSTDVDPGLPITVRETVRMARYPHVGMFRRFRDADRAAVERAMDRTDVTQLADRQLHDLSGGERQRVLVAQGLAQDADLLLLDEPVTGLDLVSREVVLAVVEEERAAGRSVVLTTHSLEEASRCDVVVLLAGRMVAAGPPGAVIDDEHLQAAFGSRVHRLATGELVLDDPHHAH